MPTDTFIPASALPDLLTAKTDAQTAAENANTATTAAQDATARALLAATLTLRTAQQSRATNGLYGQRSGRGLPTFERGAATFLSNDGTGPFTTAESPKMIRFSWAAGTQDAVAYTSFRGKASPTFDPAGRLSASVWLRLADLANVTFVELLLFGYASPGSPTTPVIGPQMTPTQLATPGYTTTVTSGGVDITVAVGAVRGGWAQVTATTATGLGATTTFVEFLIRARTTGAGHLDLMAPAMLNTADAIAPQALPRDVLDLSPEEAARLPVLTSNDYWALGDSIVRGQTYSSEGNTWARLFANKRGLTLHNLGINGSNACSPGAPGGNALVDRTGAIPDGAGGLAEISIGTNDWNNAGTCPLGAPGSTDKSNYYGAMLVSGRDVLRRTTCFLILSTPLWRGDTDRTEGTRLGGWTLEQYRQAVRDVATQLADEYPGRVMLLDAGRDLYDFFSGSGMGPDNLHPADAGNLRLAQYRDQRIPRFRGPRLPIDGQATVFGQFAAGSSLSGQAGWTAYAGATATISGDRRALNLVAPFDGAASGNPATSPSVLHDLPAGVRRVAAQITPVNVVGTGVILRAFHSRATNRAICAWVVNGEKLDCGVIQGGVVEGGSWLGTDGPVLVGQAAVNLEVLREGGQIEVRYWPATQPRPDAPSYTHADVALAADAYGLSTIGGTTQTVLSVTVAG